MNEEEKKAIDILKHVILVGNFESYNSEGIIIEAINTALNLLEKPQKETEELKKPKDNIQVVYGGRSYGKTLKAKNYITKEYISKDRIKELLQRYDKDIAWANADDHYYFVKFIKELLEEEK